MTARGQILDNFRKKKNFHAWKPEFNIAIFPVIPVTPWRPLQFGGLGSCPADSPLSRAHANCHKRPDHAVMSDSLYQFPVERLGIVKFVFFCGSLELSFSRVCHFEKFSKNTSFDFTNSAGLHLVKPAREHN